MESARLRLGVQEALSDRDDLCGQRYCQFSIFVADENLGASSAMQIGLQETNEPTSYTDWGHFERPFSFIEERENYSFTSEPNAFTYRGAEAYTYTTL